MAPLSEDRRKDDDERAGKARLLESFISEAGSSSDNSQYPAEVTYSKFRDKKGSLVINLHREKSEEPVQEEEVVDYTKKLREKHKAKAKLALVVVFGLIAFMAVFAFMNVRKHHDHHMAADGSMNPGIMKMLVGNFTGLDKTDWEKVNSTVLVEKEWIKANKTVT